MKTKTIFIVSMLCMIIFPISSRSQVNPMFVEAWTKYKNAVLEDKRETVADLTVIPFYYGQSLDRAQFIKEFPRLFPAKMKKCFQTAKPAADGEMFVVFCGTQTLRFGKMDGKMMLLEMADVD